MTDGPVGVIEGFYGPPWSWDDRIALARWCAARGMRDYVYAPKDDPKHREAWRAPYDTVELAAFERFAGDGSLQLGFAISPGLTMAYDDPTDRAALAAKVDQVVAVGARWVVLALDDIPFGGRPQGVAHAEITTWLHDHLAGRAALALVPTEYVGTAPSPYLDALADGVPACVPIGWTGSAVVNDEVTAAQAGDRAAALGGRRPLLWDNFPVNDGLMADRLFLGPLRGRPPDLLAGCDGYLANPMVQPVASRLPLASVGAFLRGDDPEEAWRVAATDLGWLVLAEACDGDTPHDVVRAAAAGELGPARALFADAAACTAPGLEEEAAPWIAQTQREARLALMALDVLAGDHGVDTVLGLAIRWQRARRAEVAVFGPRCSIRPRLGQAPDGTWQVERGAVQHDASTVDELVRLALASL